MTWGPSRGHLHLFRRDFPLAITWVPSLIIKKKSGHLTRSTSSLQVVISRKSSYTYVFKARPSLITDSNLDHPSALDAKPAFNSPVVFPDLLGHKIGPSLIPN